MIDVPTLIWLMMLSAVSAVVMALWGAKKIIWWFDSEDATREKRYKKTRDSIIVTKEAAYSNNKTARFQRIGNVIIQAARLALKRAVLLLRVKK